MANHIKRLIDVAKHQMANSTDPLHDLSHVKRVVKHTRQIASHYQLTKMQKQALTLAAWWHDMSRTTTKRTSLIWMPLMDDILSAWMLWMWTIRCGLFGSIVGLSTRMIICKSLGTGAFFTRFLLRKKNRILVDILKDADILDVVHVERAKVIFSLVDSSTVYRFGYRIIVWWALKTKSLSFRTKEADQYFRTLFKQLLTWIVDSGCYDWHQELFGSSWTKRNMSRAYHLQLQPQ